MTVPFVCLPSYNGNDGHVELLECTATDLDIVRAAQVSFDSYSEEFGDREYGILNSLVRGRHGTPFEHNVIRWRVKAPIFVFREWHRHRVGISINEVSGRYTELDMGYYVPRPEAVRRLVGKPIDYQYETLPYDEGKKVSARIDASSNAAHGEYRRLLEMGVAKEVARVVLPVNTYSMMLWTCNVRSLINFFSLRAHPAAQQEIQAYAKAMEAMIREKIPYTMRLWDQYERTSL